jgi:dihydroorotate dehydrogenase electron transfer subunit
MIAGGVGLAPFATLAEALHARGTTMTLFYGGRRSADIYKEDFFERLGVTVVITTEDGSRGERGRVTIPLERRLSALVNDVKDVKDVKDDRATPITLYACGPTPMMRAVAELAARYSRPAFVSLEPVMGCGMGGCYSCVVRVRRGASTHFVRSCLDGPVFDASAVIWDALRQGH